MAANMCDVNHLDADVLLPPRKRLLAGLKKQTSDGNGALVPPVAACPSTSSSATSNEYDAHLSSLLTSHLNNPNLTPKEIAEKSRSDAAAAVKAAKAARSAAEEKAATAAKAVAAAKSALDLVASFSEEGALKEDGTSKERYLKKNKLKKHVPVQLLYTKQQSTENGRSDEDLAQKLHRAINSSPRISKTSSTSERKGHKHKKLKSSPAASEKARHFNGGIVSAEHPHLISNGYPIAGVLDSDDSNDGLNTTKPDLKSLRYEKGGHSDPADAEAESSHSKVKMREDTNFSSKKRGRVKLKTPAKHL